MKNSLLIFLLSVVTVTITGQTDPEAVKILDRFSTLSLGSPSVSMKFKLITVNPTEQLNDTVSGSIIISKDMYRLELPDNKTWFNGSVTWNYLVREKEVTITKPDKKDDSFLTRPSSIFTLYKKGYKTKFIEENSNSFIVDLYPEDLKSDLIRIRLAIGKSSPELVGAEYKRKDGTTIYLVVNEYNLKVKPDPSIFTFDPKNYKGVEIIDMR
jgi:outer membrane lipoprotein-sorting protein